jgi:putative transposase
VADDIAQIEIYQGKNGSYYLSITYNVPCLYFKHNDKYLAMDIGVSKHTMVDSDGYLSEVINNRPDKYWEPKIQQIQSRLDHCKRYSKKWYRLKRNLNRMKQKSSNQLKDFQHKKTRNIVDNTDANVIILGDLSAKQMATSKKGDKKSDKSTHRGIHNSGHIGRFAQFLTYKSIRVGKRIIEIDESYTSQDCCNCGNRKKMSLYERTYNCPYCRQSIDRDKNSAILIMERYLRQNALWTGYQRFADNLRQTGLLIGVITH